MSGVGLRYLLVRLTSMARLGRRARRGGKRGREQDLHRRGRGGGGGGGSGGGGGGRDGGGGGGDGGGGGTQDVAAPAGEVEADRLLLGAWLG